MAIYGYARVSTDDQNLDRQLQQLKEYVKDDRFIITDKKSGKDFDRLGYNSLVGSETNSPLLRAGDTLIITSIDRLGRNYNQILKEWQKLTKDMGIKIKVLDLPLLDTTNAQNLDSQFIADLVLQILSYVAEKERINIRTRQKQGIENAKQKGVKMGRPKIEYPTNWASIYENWQNGKITAVECQKILGLKPATFYRLVKAYKQD